MGLVIYVICVILTVLLMHVADLVHPTTGDVRIGVFIGVLYVVAYFLGAFSYPYPKSFWTRAPGP
jgi:hypothetical protein